MSEEIKLSQKSPKFKVGYKVRIIRNKNVFSKCYTKSWLKEIFVIDSVWNTTPWTYKTKDLNGETIIGSFYEKESLLREL